MMGLITAVESNFAFSCTYT